MKILKMLAVVNSATNTELINNIINNLNNAEVQYESDIENAVSIMNQQRYDLLIIDKSLPERDYKKVTRLSEILHPDAASVEFNFNDEDFMRFKIGGLMIKWKEAQSDGNKNFIDKPSGF